MSELVELRNAACLNICQENSKSLASGLKDFTYGNVVWRKINHRAKGHVIASKQYQGRKVWTLQLQPHAQTIDINNTSFSLWSDHSRKSQVNSGEVQDHFPSIVCNGSYIRLIWRAERDSLPCRRSKARGSVERTYVHNEDKIQTSLSDDEIF